MSPVLEDHSNNPVVATTLRVRVQQLHRVDAISRTVGRSRNDVLEQFLTWAESEWKKEATPAQLAVYEEHLKAIRTEHDAPLLPKKRPTRK
ncbi:MAG: hypothetical protein EOO71_27955 [Myxococcaceae bacterium]|nr:MAG: hypothetical protein EOO71_27955 [Myxococcaceae bacterium]